MLRANPTKPDFSSDNYFQFPTYSTDKGFSSQRKLYQSVSSLFELLVTEGAHHLSYDEALPVQI